jgi:8-amino-7-oxononanoate synthase
LIAGDHPEHRALEREVASWLECDDALVFSSGYAANVGLVSALAGPGDLIVSDALNHASMIDGCRLSRAHVIVVPHGDAEAIGHALSSTVSRQARRRLVLTEGYFSMDGDTPDLAKIRELCTASDAAMIVDDAHALGVIGPRGRGACAEAGVTPDAIVGTFGKSIGGQGAFVAGPRSLTDWLWNRARSFVFSTGLSPWVAALDLAGVRRARDDDAGRARLNELSLTLRAALREMRLDVLPGRGPIVPVMMGADAAAMDASRRLLEAGIQVAAIRPPTVPVGTARLRVTLHARLTDHDLERAIDAFRRVAVAESNPT